MTSQGPSLRKVFALGVVVVLLVVAGLTSFSLFEYLDSSQVMVIQYPSGKLKVATQPGIYGQWFGSVTKYKKRDQFWFSASTDQGKKTDESIKIRFNDGGHAMISGSIAWEMPADETNLVSLHMKYRGHHAVEQQLVRTVLEKSVYMTGPLMSSAESYAARRNELLNLIDDQIVHGVFKTEAIQERFKDTMTGIDKTVTVVHLIKGPDGKYLRQDSSPLEEFGLKTFNLAINQVAYDETVEKQIQQQQAAIMQVQTAIAGAKEAEQRAITVEKNGQANAAEAKWKQEVIKAQFVTEAQQKLEVARLATQEAEQYKRAEILRGEGEGERKRLIMAADGALEKKLAAWLESQKSWANAYSKAQQPIVPGVVMGNGVGSAVAGSGLQQFMEILAAKAAKDLGIDMGVSGTEKTRGSTK